MLLKFQTYVHRKEKRLTIKFSSILETIIKYYNLIPLCLTRQR